MWSYLGGALFLNIITCYLLDRDTDEILKFGESL